MKQNIFYPLCVMALLGLLAAGCTRETSGNLGKMPNYVFPRQEAAWIRNGEPIEFEGYFWYPQDGIDVLLDSEVVKLGVYRGVEFFADQVDVRPLNRIYTKFGRNKFRFFERRAE